MLCPGKLWKDLISGYDLITLIFLPPQLYYINVNLLSKVLLSLYRLLSYHSATPMISRKESIVIPLPNVTATCIEGTLMNVSQPRSNYGLREVRYRWRDVSATSSTPVTAQLRYSSAWCLHLWSRFKVYIRQELRSYRDILKVPISSEFAITYNSRIRFAAFSVASAES